MIAHQIDHIAESLGLQVEVPERDAFILKGGAFNLRANQIRIFLKPEDAKRRARAFVISPLLGDRST